MSASSKNASGTGVESPASQGEAPPNSDWEAMPSLDRESDMMLDWEVLPASVGEAVPTSVRETDPTSVREIVPATACETDPTSVRETTPTSVRETVPATACETVPTSAPRQQSCPSSQKLKDCLSCERLAEAESFSHAVAHDMSGVLNNVKSLAKRAQQKIKDQQALEKYLSKIVICSDQALEIVKGLYQLSGLTKNRMEFREFFLDEIVRKALSNLQGKDRAADLVAAVDCSVQFLGSPEMMLLVFQNLAGNALKYVPLDRNPEIRVSVESYQDYMQISFEDNGQGIPEEHREKVFRPFERLHGEDISGLGLGLSIVRRIIEQHRGTIKVEASENLGGAKFVIKVPHLVL